MAKKKAIKKKPGPAKGVPKVKDSGRVVGSQSKKKVALQERLQATILEHTGIVDWCPVMSMAMCAADHDKKKSDLELELKRLKEEQTQNGFSEVIEQQIEQLEAQVYNLDEAIPFQCKKEVSKYIYPQLKAVEHKADKENPVSLIIKYADE